ncbi:MFS transporter [Aquihabitans sp. McL0605]|uniref:MFS transporter n=1 Tax=Aquihabitans sp. McL0605 TaxID=3415671 RepID=UPI003CE81FC5
MTATTPPVQHEIDPEIYKRRWLILPVLCTSLMIVIIGNTALNVAIPTLSKALDASNSQLEWIVAAYSLVFAGMLFTAGTIGDRFGRKGALQAGLVGFLAGTLLASTADSAATVIGGRVVMGLAAAFIMPSTLSILTNVFPAHERPKAIAIWAGVSGAGAAIGPLASGYLLGHFYWGSVFLVNVPVILIALVLGYFLVPKSRDPEQSPLDLPGALLSIIGLGALVYSIIEGPTHGWLSATSAATFGLAIAGIAAFIWRENTAKHPMLDLKLFKDRRFSVASVGMTLTFFAMFGTFFLVAQYFQLVLGYSPLKSGLLTLPMAIVMMAIAPQVPKLVGRFGAHRVVPAGLTFIAIGMAFFSQVQVDSPIWFIYLSIIPLGAGMATTMTPLTTLIMSSVPLGKAGVGSAMNDTTRELGGALGVAVLGSIVTSAYKSNLHDLGGLPASARHLADSGLAGALTVAAKTGGVQGAAIANSARAAFVDGIGLAAMVAGIVVIIAAIAAWFLLPHHFGVQAGTTVAEHENQTDLSMDGSLDPDEIDALVDDRGEPEEQPSAPSGRPAPVID